MDIAVDARIDENMKQLKKIIKLVPKERRPIAEKLAKEIAFMSKTLDDLKTAIEEQGAIDLFKQGAQEFLRENPALKSYTTLIQRYGGLYKQLTDLLPDAQPVKNNTTDKLLEFLSNGLHNTVPPGN
ncbi:MAG: hypothetical protein AB9835_14490 [Eubacteriales bacterium]